MSGTGTKGEDTPAIPIKGQTQRLTLYLDPHTYAWIGRVMQLGSFNGMSTTTAHLLTALRLQCQETGKEPLGWSSAIYTRNYKARHPDTAALLEGESLEGNVIRFPTPDCDGESA